MIESDGESHFSASRQRQLPPLPGGLWAAVNRLAGNRNWPPELEAETRRFLAAAERNRLLPLVANDAAAPPAVAAAAREGWLRQEHGLDRNSAAIDKEVEGLIALLEPHQCLFFNGAAFRHNLYPDAALRPMDDIDVLVRSTDLDPVKRRLHAAGYGLAGGYFVRKPAEIKVEITPLFTPRERHCIDYDEIWNARLTGSVGAPRAAPHHELLLHAMGMAGRIYLIPARKYLDLWLLSRSDAVVEQAIDVAARWEAKRMLHVTMVQLTRFLRDARSTQIAERTGRMLRPAERRFVERFVVPPSVVNSSLSLADRVLRRLSLLDTPGRRIRATTAKVSALARNLGGS